MQTCFDLRFELEKQTSHEVMAKNDVPWAQGRKDETVRGSSEELWEIIIKPHQNAKNTRTRRGEEKKMKGRISPCLGFCLFFHFPVKFIAMSMALLCQYIAQEPLESSVLPYLYVIVCGVCDKYKNVIVKHSKYDQILSQQGKRKTTTSKCERSRNTKNGT